MALGMLELRDFAARYTDAWCSQNPASVAAFFSEDAALRVNDSPPAVGRNAVDEVTQSFMTHFRTSRWSWMTCCRGAMRSSITGLSPAQIPGREARATGSASAVLRNGEW